MKKNLILLTSLIPLGISTVPFVTSCGPKITDKSISWDFNKHGQYNSRVSEKSFANPITQDEALDIYLKDLYEQPYIFIDDYMVVLDAMCYTIKQYGFTLDTATIDMSIDVTKDDNHGYLISLSNELHVKISYDGMLIYSFDGKEVIKNIQYMFKYKEEDGGTVLPLVKEWSILPRPLFVCDTCGTTSTWKDYFASLNDLVYSVDMQYEEEDTDGHHSMKISFDNTNYNDQTVDMVSTCFDTRLVKLLYSKYLSKANIKEDILLDKINDDKIEYNGTITLDTNKFYIVKIDLKDWEGDPSTGLALVWEGDYEGKIKWTQGLNFISLNNEKIIHKMSGSTYVNYAQTPDVKGLKKGDVITTSLYFTVETWNSKVENAKVYSCLHTLSL